MAYKLVLDKLYPNDPDRYRVTDSMLYSQFGPNFKDFAYKSKLDEILKTDSYKVEHCLDNDVVRCNDAVAMMYEYEVRLDQVVKRYVERCFEKLRDTPEYSTGYLSEREARELVVVRAYNELCPPAFYKAMRVIFDTCPSGVAANIADEILERHVGSDYRGKSRDWYSEHKTL